MHLSLVLAACIALICADAGLAKVRDPQSFVRAVRAYDILTGRLVAPAALAIGVGELAIAVLMIVAILGQTAVANGATLASALFLTFAVALGLSLSRGSKGPCHCFGSADVESISGWTVTRALVLLGLSASLFVLPWHPTGIGVADIVADTTIALGLAATLRLLGLLPIAWAWIRQPAMGLVPPTSRLTFRYSPASESLFDGDPLPVTHSSILTIDEAFAGRAEHE